MWQVCFKEYDGGGMLVGLKPVKAARVHSLWRRIDSYLSACQKGMVREVGFYRDGKNYPSIVSDGSTGSSTRRSRQSCRCSDT